jgi:hypothetical protein
LHASYVAGDLVLTGPGEAQKEPRQPGGILVRNSPKSFEASLHRLRGFEAVAPADRGDHQVQRGVAGVIAFVDQVLRRLLTDPNLHELLRVGVMLAEVGTQSTLSFMYRKHKPLLSSVRLSFNRRAAVGKIPRRVRFP